MLILSKLKIAYPQKQTGAGEVITPAPVVVLMDYFFRSCQKATALAAATLRESTPWDMGMRTV